MTAPPSPRRPSARRGALVGLLALAFALAGCGDDEPATGDRAAPGSTDPSVAPTTAHVEAGTLPFDLGPVLVAGGDDVVAADGVDVPTGRFTAEIADPPGTDRAEAHRLVPDPAAETRARTAAAELLGDDVAEVDFHVDGGQFEFHAEGHGHDDGAPTTVAGDVDRTAADVDAAVATLRRFVDRAGLGPLAGEPTTFDAGGFLSVEADLALVPGAVVTRAPVSITFDAAGEPIGGFGPVGTPRSWGEFELVGMDAAVRRLELTQALAGHPTTMSVPSGPPVVLVSAEVVLARREVVTLDGTPTGDTWLVPSWRFVDDGGTSWEVIAVVADALTLP